MESLKKHLLMNSGSRSLGGNNDSQSVFFVDNSENAFAHQIQSCYEGIVEYLDAWKKFDGAGTHLLDSLHSVMKDTAYEKLGGETFNAFKSVYSSSNGIDPGGKLKEMEKLMTGLKACLDAGDKVEKNTVNNQIMSRCLLLFLKVQSDYHQMCSVTVSTLLNKLVQIHEVSENQELLQQMSMLDLIPHTGSPPAVSRGKKNSAGSESPRSTRNSTFKNSLFSLFDRKSSPEDNKCAFYVDLNQSSAKCSTNNQSEQVSASQVTQNNQSDILVQLGLDPVKEDASGEDMDLLKSESCENDDKPISQLDHTSGSAQKSASSQIATEEDLDLVINLLSGIGGGPSYMEPIPENQMHLGVPSLFNSRTPSPRDTNSDDIKVSKLHTHRRSDGCLDFHGVGNVGRGNTWPHRASLPTSSLANNLTAYPDYMNFGANTVPRRYSHDLNMNSRLPHAYTSPLGSGHNLEGYHWGGYTDTKYNNRTWPLNSGGLSAHLGSDATLNSSWSAIPDSDDLSDDSSCGDQFFAVGLDLVGAIDSKNYSSDDEGQKQKSPNDDRPHSAEDLLTERPAVNPWSPKQVWSQPCQTAGSLGGDELVSPELQPNQSHRPVSMQWSDPLANRNMWNASGLGSSQSMHGFGPVQ